MSEAAIAHSTVRGDSAEHLSIGNTRQHNIQEHTSWPRGANARSVNCPASQQFLEPGKTTFGQHLGRPVRVRSQGEQRSCSYQGKRAKKEEQQSARTINTHDILPPVVARMLQRAESATWALLDSVKKQTNHKTSQCQKQTPDDHRAHRWPVSQYANDTKRNTKYYQPHFFI